MEFFFSFFIPLESYPCTFIFLGGKHEYHVHLGMDQEIPLAELSILLQ